MASHTLLTLLVERLKMMWRAEVSTREEPVLPMVTILKPIESMDTPSRRLPPPLIRTAVLRTETFVCPVVSAHHPGWRDVSAEVAVVVFSTFDPDQPLVVWDVLHSTKGVVRATATIMGEKKIVEGKGRSYNIYVAGMRTSR